MAVEDSVARDQLRAFVERIERMNEEKAAINADISDIYKEAKGNGFDTKVLKKIIADRSRDANERLEFEAIYELYAVALGMIETPDFDEPRVHVQVRVREADEIAAPANPEITEQQVAPQPASDLASSPSPQGEVAPIQPEPEGALSEVALPTTDEDTSLSGQESASGTRSAGGDGSSPSQAPVYPAPGIVTMEHTPPEGIVAHPFAAVWPVNNVDVSEGVREPIVKIGKLILDGRGRYFAARAECIEYPVVQYDGTDPLMDSIRWNLASRPGLHPHNLKMIAHKLAKLEPSRADEIMAAFGVQTEEAA